MRRTLLALTILPPVLLLGCERTRDAQPGQVTWREDVAPLVEESCVDCHSGSTPDGDYRLTSYLAALGTGSDDTPNALAGDPQSRLLVHLSEPGHVQHLGGGDEEVYEERLSLLTRWVVDSDLAYFRSGFHEGGVLNRRDGDFHGRTVAREGWGMESCRNCHGESYDGNDDISAPSCLGCHPSTPEDCSTCHGTGAPGERPPSLRDGAGPGAHALHLDPSNNFEAVECSTCHPVPANLTDGSHIDGRVDLVFTGRAAARGTTPAWNAATRTCSDVACHGAGLEGGELPEPEWHVDASPASCRSCHGLPPTETAAGVPHPASLACDACHAPAAGPNVSIADPSLHADGVVQLVPGVNMGCNACHTSPGGALPFRDRRGRTDESLVAVGAHNTHLIGGLFNEPIACSACHVMPTAIDSPTHLDGTVQVAMTHPAAVAGGLSPRWEAATATCADNGCHGAGLDGATNPDPVWNGPPNQVGCGSCHGLPPTITRTGDPHPQANTCGSCHGRVIDDNWQWVDRRLHLNGQVELGGAP